MKIGDRVFIHGYVDEIRKETVIIRNKGGYFGTDKSEVIVSAKDMEPVVRCKDCRWYDNSDVCHNPRYGDGHANYQPPYVDEDYWCKDGERKGGDDE